MKNMDKFLSLLGEEADGLLLTSRYSRQTTLLTRREVLLLKMKLTYQFIFTKITKNVLLLDKNNDIVSFFEKKLHSVILIEQKSLFSYKIDKSECERFYKR